MALFEALLVDERGNELSLAVAPSYHRQVLVNNKAQFNNQDREYWPGARIRVTRDGVELLTGDMCYYLRENDILKVDYDILMRSLA